MKNLFFTLSLVLLVLLSFVSFCSKHDNALEIIKTTANTSQLTINAKQNFCYVGYKEWSDTKSLSSSVAKGAAKDLIDKKTKGTDCQCKDNSTTDDGKKDPTLDPTGGYVANMSIVLDKYGA